MGRKIICPECNTIFDETVLKQKNSEDTCLVCGASLSGDDNSDHEESPIEDKQSVDEEKAVEKKTFYYYKEGGGTLDDMLFDGWKPLYTFQAINIEDAERQLKEKCPDSIFFRSSPSSEVRCPRCFSTEYTLLNRGFSIFTGFLGSGKVKRVCNHCKKEF